MKRPILIATIGYIIGIIMGLYFKISIVFLYALLASIVVIVKLLNKKFRKKKEKFKLFSLSRYFRYIKLFLNSKVILIIILFSVISNTIVILKNHKYANLYNENDTIEIIGIIVSSKTPKEYKNIYKVRVLEADKYKEFKDICLYLYTDKKIDLEYGNKVKIKGNCKKINGTRNFGGFNYREYLRQLNIYGIITAESVDIIKRQDISKISLSIHNLQQKIKKNAKNYFSEEIYSIFLGLIMGDTSNIDENTQEQFRTSNMSHILAVSGMHISFIIMGCSILLNKILGKRISKIITIIVLILYCLITGFSPSIFRASVMGIMILLGGIIHRKSDTWNSIAISLLVILIYNPYLISNIGLQFSYIATLGIIILNKNILKILKADKSNKLKIKEIVAISLSAQIFILPINIFHFNTFSMYFIITNIFLSIIIGPTIIFCFIFLILSIFDFGILNIIANIISILISLIQLISNISSFPLAKIYIRTPRIYEIILYYIIILIANIIYSKKNKKKPSTSDLRLRYILEVIKFKIRSMKKSTKKWSTFMIIFVFLFVFVIKIPHNLKIHFVDVGQGDCCFIETPNNKTILIDGGGSELGTFDVGKSVLLPYILDRGYTRIDYIFISHFDSDHVGGLFTVMQELEVNTIVISKQGKTSENYEKFKDIINRKHIKVLTINKGDTLKIEKDLYFNILWPNQQKMISENILNNNSIVCKLNYKNFSILFTGDIEQIAEKQILEEYKNNKEILNSTILKVGHHGSKTSSIQEFVNVAKPKIALIGVGEDNKFGHPNQEVIKRLENLNTMIYRTDKMGEISIDIDYKNKIRVNKCIK